MNTQSNPITIAISADFLSAFSQVPRSQQTKALDFVNKFRANPTSTSINYEPIHGAKDKHLRSVRIDQAYRGIVLRPDTGNTYVLLWIGHHDDAYRWAMNKVCAINPETGSLQVIDTDYVEPTVQEADATSRTGPFASIAERNLIKLGVPDILLPLVRSIRSDGDLDRLADRLPQEAYEALFFVASGFSVDEVLTDMAARVPLQVDTTDFRAALGTPDSRRRFHVVEDDLELMEILNAPLDRWRIFLHPTQRRLVENDWNGPVRVTGGAGTGKTVVAIHRAKWLAEHIFTKPEDKVLVTTFSRNLAADLRDNLARLCSKDTLDRIEVVNLDKWASDFLRKHGFGYRVVYGEELNRHWGKALALAATEFDLPQSFYREEWGHVIQAQGLTNIDQYLRASRIGRGIRLSRSQRKAIWSVFEEYRTQLNDHMLCEIDDAYRAACDLLVQLGNVLPYRSVVVDEGQDFGEQAYRLIRQLLPGIDLHNDLFIVGDAHQRIYRSKVVLSKCGVNVAGRGRTLRINYRTTDEIRKWASEILQGVAVDDLDGGIEVEKGYKALLRGERPNVRAAKSYDDEIELITKFVRERVGDGEDLRSICLVTLTNDMADRYAEALRRNGIETYRIKRSATDDRRVQGVRLATMHRVKGLEFDRVIIAGLNHDTDMHRSIDDSTCDAAVKQEMELQRRCLLYVAATRAKKEVVFTYSGRPSKYVPVPTSTDAGHDQQ
jgi:superfamily I DNA/RNA helicase